MNFSNRTTVDEFLHRAMRDGRAVLIFRATPFENGDSRPHLWLCKIGPTLVACEDSDDDVVETGDEFLEAVKGSDRIVSVVRAYRLAVAKRKKSALKARRLYIL